MPHSAKALFAAIPAFALAACVTGTGRSGPAIAPGARYVAMGSSFAAGPGVDPVEQPPPTCGRSTRNYAHHFAGRRSLMLVDVSCGGATTAHVLGPWQDIPPQIDSITP